MRNRLKCDILSKNTIETSYLFTSDFTQLFSTQCTLTEKEVYKLLLPRGKASSWATLDLNITKLAKRFQANLESSKNTNEYQEYEEIINYLDKVRFMIAELPQKLDYKPSENKLNSITPELAQKYFTTCSLCWRSVLVSPLQKKAPLCHLHDLPSQNPTYRKLYRLKKEVEAEKLRLIKSLPPLTHIKRTAKLTNNELNLNDYVKSLCLSPDTPLAHLRAYFQNQSIKSEQNQLQPYTHKIQKKDSRAVLEALESLIYQHTLSNFAKETWNFYLDDRANHFRLTYIQLLTAEAWLKTEQTKTHGGKRR